MESVIKSKKKKKLPNLPPGNRMEDTGWEEQGHPGTEDVYQPMNAADANHADFPSQTEVKNMKKLSKRRTLLFIPSFRKKNIKLFRDAGPLEDAKDVDSGRDTDSLSSSDSKGDNLSIRSSLSSLDSGIGSSSSSSSLMSCRDTGVIVEEPEVKGRAPIASPEDDSLLEDPSVKTECDLSGNSTSFHTISDSSSCSCASCDSSSDSDYEERVQSDSSDSDLSPKKTSVKRVSTDSDSVKRVSTDSDSDSDIDECSSFFPQEKCYTAGPSVVKPVNSIVHTNSVNRRARIKTNGSVKPHMLRRNSQLVTPLPTYARSHGIVKSSSSTDTSPNTSSLMSNKSCNFSINSDSAFQSCNTSQDTSDVNCGNVSFNDSVRRNRISYCEPAACAKQPTLQRSASERRSRSRLRSPTLQVRNSSLNREVLQNQPCMPNLPPDSSKSLEDVRQSMQNTAFWVKNNCYDSQPDESATPLLPDKKELSERALCQEIIGIYFGDESDSSLLSSLDNSIDDSTSSTSSSSCADTSSLPRTIETNIDDFTTAVYIPAKAAEAHTRKLASAKLIKKTPRMTSTTVAKTSVPSVDIKKSDDHSSSGVKLCCEKKPIPALSEHEVDTITKLHTICNGQRIVRYLNITESPMIHFPPPKRASRISWNQALEDDRISHHSPRNTPTKPRSVLRQRPGDFIFPYVEDTPSPIVITRVRRSKSLTRPAREWPW